MNVIINESGMQFGKYRRNQVFRIELSEQYNNLRGYGIKSCEFILLRDDILFFVEAKSSCPRQIVKKYETDDIEEKKQKYNEYINEIVLKMRHSLSLYGNILLRRYSQDNISCNLLNPDLSKTEIKLILVINTKSCWEPDPELQDDLNQQLADVMKIWNIKRFLVLSDKVARKKSLIL